MNNNNNLIYRLLKSLIAHIQVKIIFIKLIYQICSTHDHYLTRSDLPQDECQRE
jgi:hypothetical protein